MMRERHIKLHSKLLGKPSKQAQPQSEPVLRPNNPEQVAIARLIKEAEFRRGQKSEQHPFPAGTPRHYFCKSCEAARKDVHIPDGWYWLERHTERSKIIAMYSSLSCLVKHIPQLLMIDEDYQSWEAPPPKIPAAEQPQRDERVYFCRQCGKDVKGFYIPFGWYTIQRSQPVPLRPLRLGMFCSIVCLSQQMPRLIGIGHELDERNLIKRDEP